LIVRLGTHRVLEQLAGVVLHRLQLAAQVLVAVVQHGADGLVDEGVEGDHEGEELEGHERQRGVEVEDLAGLGQRRRDQQRVGGKQGAATGGRG
jgi:hypothetical protein